MNENIKSFQNMLELHRSMTRQLEQRMTALTQPRTPAAALAQMAADFDATTAALVGATKERDQIMKYWDERIAMLQARVERQQQAIKDMQQVLSEKEPMPTRDDSTQEG